VESRVDNKNSGERMSDTIRVWRRVIKIKSYQRIPGFPLVTLTLPLTSPHPYGSRLSWKQVGAWFLLSVVLFSQGSDRCADSSDPDSKLLMQTGPSCPPPNSTSSRPKSSSTPSSQTQTPVSISSSTSKPVSRRARPSIAFRLNVLHTFCGDIGSTSGFNPEARDRDIPFTAKDEPATLPRVQELVVICESSPWCTIVKNERGVTLQDVCTTIWKECVRPLCSIPVWSAS